jgi:hypothetical protein
MITSLNGSEFLFLFLMIKNKTIQKKQTNKQKKELTVCRMLVNNKFPLCAVNNVIDMEVDVKQMQPLLLSSQGNNYHALVKALSG